MVVDLVTSEYRLLSCHSHTATQESWADTLCTPGIPVPLYQSEVPGSKPDLGDQTYFQCKSEAMIPNPKLQRLFFRIFRVIVIRNDDPQVTHKLLPLSAHHCARIHVKSFYTHDACPPPSNSLTELLFSSMSTYSPRLSSQ